MSLVRSSLRVRCARPREETGDCTLVTRLKTRVEAGAERDRSPDPMCELHSLSLFDFEVLIHCASKNTRSARAPDTAVFRYPLPVMFIVGAPSMCALPTAALSLACPPHQKAYLNLKLWAHRQRALSQRHIHNVQRALWLLATPVSHVSSQLGEASLGALGVGIRFWGSDDPMIRAVQVL